MRRSLPISTERAARSLACASILGALIVAAPGQAADPFLRRTATVDVVERVGV